MNDTKIAIIPSCHNTDQLVKVLANFKRNLVDEVCVVVDCASANDLTQIEKIAEKNDLSIHVISHPERRGVGISIRNGIEYAIKKKFDIAIIMAGNGKDQPNEIPRLLKPISVEGYDYVQGSRFLKGGKRVRNPFFRGVFSRLYPFIWNLLTKSRCTDVTNGFRAYRLNLFLNRRIDLWQNWLDGYELEYYIHYKVLTLNYRMKEVPVSKIYQFNHKGGYSNIAPFRDWWKIVGPLIYLKLGARK